MALKDYTLTVELNNNLPDYLIRASITDAASKVHTLSKYCRAGISNLIKFEKVEGASTLTSLEFYNGYDFVGTTAKVELDADLPIPLDKTKDYGISVQGYMANKI